MTGFSLKVRASISERSGGVCEVCGQRPAVHKHHRRPRKAGGDKTPETNSIANGLHVCLHCHDLIEKNRIWAQVFGYLVPEWPSRKPSDVAVRYRGRFVHLEDDGSVNPVEYQQ